VVDSNRVAEVQGRLVEATVEIVSAYVSNNRVPPTDIQGVIFQVHGSLGRLEHGVPEKAPPQAPAVPIKKSIHPDYLVCLEDGKKLKMLRRHLRVSFGLTPEQYRAKWALPVDYPMTAPNYTRGRSEFAKKVGFGTKKARAAARARAGKK
jgi:predicted transcriptional regulator